MTVVWAPRVLLPDGTSGPGAVVVDSGRVSEFRPGRPRPSGLQRPDDVVLPSGLLAPGLVDLQVNGCFGVDFATADPTSWAPALGRLTSRGVTAVLATLVTASPKDLAAALDRVAEARDQYTGTPCTQVIGAHVEGPFLAPDRAGAHDRGLLVDPTEEAVDTLLRGEQQRRVLRMLTLAPERPGALAAVRRLSARGVVVALGHSDATAEQTGAAVDAGARMVTHLFNAQSALGHREPGLPGRALVEDRLGLGLIADLQHVHPDVVRLVMAAAGARVALVTDSVAAAGMPPGRHRLGATEIWLATEDPVPRLLDGTRAGSTLTLDQAVRNLVGLGVDPAVALRSATQVPADILGRPDLGRIAPGAVADLVWWADDLQPRRVWVAGQEAGGGNG